MDASLATTEGKCDEAVSTNEQQNNGIPQWISKYPTRGASRKSVGRI
jgi:hypothetical protein